MIRWHPATASRADPSGSWCRAHAGTARRAGRIGRHPSAIDAEPVGSRLRGRAARGRRCWCRRRSAGRQRVVRRQPAAIHADPASDGCRTRAPCCWGRRRSWRRCWRRRGTSRERMVGRQPSPVHADPASDGCGTRAPRRWRWRGAGAGAGAGAGGGGVPPASGWSGGSQPPFTQTQPATGGAPGHADGFGCGVGLGVGAGGGASKLPAGPPVPANEPAIRLPIDPNPTLKVEFQFGEVMLAAYPRVASRASLGTAAIVFSPLNGNPRVFSSSPSTLSLRRSRPTTPNVP